MYEFTSHTGDGSAVQVALIRDPNGSQAMKFLEVLGRFGVEKARATSAQLGTGDGLDAYYDIYAVEAPPVQPYHYSELYRRDDTMRACVDARVEAVAKQGWRIRPRAEVWPTARVADFKEAEQEPNYTLQEEIVAFFEGGLPDYDFSEMLGACWLDHLVTGNGYIELIRDARGRPAKMALAKSVTMRIARDLPGFVQQRGQNKQWFVRYGVDAKAIRLRRRDQDTRQTSKGTPMLTPNPLFLPVAIEKAAPGDNYVGTNEFRDWMAKADRDGLEIVTRAHEIIHFRIPTPRDTPYGEPPIISAAESYLGGQNARLFMLSYFDNATVPRMAIFIKGGGSLNQQVLQKIDQWMASQNKLDALNQVLIAEVGEGSEIQIERLSSEQLNDDGGFLRYKEACSQAIRRSYRVPPSVTFDLEGLNNAVSAEADRKFLEFVVRPDQRLIEARFNNLIEREYNTREWVLDLSVPDLTMIEERRNLWNMLLTRGAISVNEVRRELGMSPLKGGDVPILFIPGQGYVPLDAFADADAVKEMLTSARKRMQTADMQTPPKGDSKKAMVNVDAAQGLPEDVQVELAHLAEQLGVGTPEHLAMAFPAAFPPN